MQSAFLSAEWRYLAMLNYSIDPAVLHPLIPYGTEPDTWNGITFVSMVGFLFLQTKVRGIGIPFHRNFEEVNLRFYVRRKDGHTWKRGVVFVREIVPRFAIAAVARGLYNEKYVAMPMRHHIDTDGKNGLVAGGSVRYEWRLHNRWNSLAVQTTGTPSLPATGSEEEFITEHYWGYAAQRNGGCVEYRVAHPQWRVWQAAEARLECDAATLYGPQFAEALQAPPHSAFVADGSGITVSGGVHLPM